MELAKVSDALVALRNIRDNLPNMETADVAEVFTQLKQIDTVAKPLMEDTKAELKGRASEGGRDAKGHSYLAGRSGGVKLERRVQLMLLPNAAQRLGEEGYLKHFPKAFDVERAAEILRDFSVPEASYTTPHITVKQLEGLVETGLIPASLAAELVEERPSFAVKTVPSNELNGVE